MKSNFEGREETKYQTLQQVVHCCIGTYHVSCPKVLRGFVCFIFGAVQFLNVLILTLLCVLLFNLVY